MVKEISKVVVSLVRSGKQGLPPFPPSIPIVGDELPIIPSPIFPSLNMTGFIEWG
jgi:hypothetical protein